MKKRIAQFIALLGLNILANAVEPRPNVLFIAVDDLNHWVGYLGRNPQTITPNIDKLAARGVRFTRSYCTAPVCNPSRAALLSGLRPFTSGVYENNNDWRTVISQDLALTTAFRKAGYLVCGAGKIYHEAYRRRSEWDDEELYDESKDPYEWTNLAARPEFASKKAELSKHLPKVNHPNIGGRANPPGAPANAINAQDRGQAK